jgi:amidophosphoribosyltransferase
MPTLEHEHSPIDDGVRPNCGVVGVFNHPSASVICYYALHALQHRGQEACGIVAASAEPGNGRLRFRWHKGRGLVLDVFSDSRVLTEHLRGHAAIGHNRYSTTGSNSDANIQPFAIRYHAGNLALAHNGNLTNTNTLRRQLQSEGAIFQSTSDSELFLHLIARSKAPSELERIRSALTIARGAYSLVLLTDTALYAARDPHGFRPLAIGRIRNADGTTAYIVASETCAFDIVGAEYIRDVRHNELVVINQQTIADGTIESYTIEDQTPTARHCIFEYVYFARPDSIVFGHSVDKVRRKLGKNLALEQPVEAGAFDKVTVIAVPDSGNTAALGYAKVNAEDNGIPTRFEIGLIRSHYVGRTFIAPDQDERALKVKAKFNPVRGVLEGRKVVVVDDSIVRGTTSRQLIQLLRSAGPAEVHLRITSPPITHPCRYGMDFPSRQELIANHYHDAQSIGQAIGVDSLGYLSVEGLLDSVPCQEGIGYCTACFTGDYPVEVELDIGKYSTEE